MATPHQLISFYKDCFEEENKGGGIANFLLAKVEEHTLVKGKEEHLSGLLPYTPIPEKTGKKLKAEVALYQKEKELIYGSHFLLGKYVGFQGKAAKLVAPLIIYPAKVVYENELYFIKAELEDAAVNPIIIDLIKSHKADFEETAFYKQIPHSVLTQGESGKLTRLMDQHIPNMDSSFMVDYPNNLSAYKINQLFKKHTFEDHYHLVPCSGFGIVKKSTKTRNALAELNSLSEPKTKLSAPILSLFKKSYRQKKRSAFHPSSPASTLSSAQENILDAASKYSLSMAVGPPGTGKSYTIANLAISMMSQGKSVLVCSRNDGAVNVIENKIEALLGDKSMCVRGGKREEMKALKDRLQFLLSRGYIKESRVKNRINDRKGKSTKKERQLEMLRRELNLFSKKFEKADLKELTAGERIVKHDSGNSLWNRIVRYYLSKSTDSKGEAAIWNRVKLYLQLTDQFVATAKKHIKDSFITRLHATIANDRVLVRNYLKSLRASNSLRQKQFLETIELSTLFGVFPIWLTNTKDVAEILPLDREMFDLVIIDEASQCDISTCLPLLQRAKQAVIVGDPKQLTHISFLSRAKQYFLQQKNGLNEEQSESFTYREKSILGLTEESIQEQEQSSFLDEHYRSKPDIIRFSNEQFYFNALHIMTNNLQDKTQALFHVKTKGKRNKAGVNQTEIDLIIKKVKAIIEQDRNTVAPQKQSIGILSPFRNQTDQIIDSVQQEFEISDIENHKLLIGTAHSFQGEERDIMFLSFALDNESHPTAYHFLNKEDVFNVSITRAKNQQYLITSFDKDQLSTDNLLRKYFDSLTEQPKEFNQLDGEKDLFCEEVCDFIHQIGISTRIAFSIAGVTVDIIAEHEGKLYGIDLVGFPGPYEKTIELYQYKALLRAGVEMIPIPYSLWRFEREICEKQIKGLLGMGNIETKVK